MPIRHGDRCVVQAIITQLAELTPLSKTIILSLQIGKSYYKLPPDFH